MEGGDQSSALNNGFTDNSSHEYHFSICTLAAQRSKDPVTQVGACIVKNNVNLGFGYNGFPRGCPDELFPWGKDSSDPINNKYFYVCHAELNAIVNAQDDVRGTTMYVTLFPCNDCAKMIIQHGISEVIYLSDKHAGKASTKASKLMLQQAGVKYWQYKSKKQVEIVLSGAEVGECEDEEGKLTIRLNNLAVE